MSGLLFPPKCILCQKILEREEMDICSECRKNLPEYQDKGTRHPHLAKVICLWYYKGNVRSSILRFKFQRKVAYSHGYARHLALALQDTDFDVLTWIPVSFLRRLKRGYDQCQLLAHSLGRELGVKPQRTLFKRRNTKPQSRFKEASQRRANILGAFRCVKPEMIRGKRILLLDDVITTGSTAEECARTLLTAGAKEVVLVAIASAQHTK